MPDSMTPAKRPSFDTLLHTFAAARPVGSDDVVGAVRALLEDVRDCHEDGRVADLDRVDLLALTDAGELRLGACPVGGGPARPPRTL